MIEDEKLLPTTLRVNEVKTKNGWERQKASAGNR